jgi:hypothetical protein
LYRECLTKEALEGFGNFKIGQIINNVIYADDFGVPGYGRNGVAGHD